MTPAMPPRAVWAAVLAFRLLVAATQRTSGPPDEYYQGPEVGYHLAFGRGSLTWEWDYGIRSWAHPSVFWGVFEVLRAVDACLGPLDGAWYIYTPRLLQGLIAFAGDVGMVYLAQQLVYPRGGTGGAGAGDAATKRAMSRAVLAFTVTNWFVSYCATRTFSNSVEAVLTVWAVALYAAGRDLWFLHIAGIATTVRITSAILWAFMIARRGVRVRVRAPARSRGAWVSLVEGGPIAIDWVFAAQTLSITMLWASLATAFDAVVSGRWYFSPWVFLEFNFLSGRSAAFGTHSGHWYVTQGLPAMLGPHVVCLAMYIYLTASGGMGAPHRPLGGAVGAVEEDQQRRPVAVDAAGEPPLEPLLPATPHHLALLALAATAVYSLTGHKEFRFVLPLLYLLLVPAAAAFVKVYGDVFTPAQSGDTRGERTARASKQHERNSAHQRRDGSTAPGEVASEAATGADGIGAPAQRKHTRPGSEGRALFVVMCVVHTLAGVYFCYVHQAGGVSAMRHLGATPRAASATVDALLPCYAIPGYSYLHGSGVTRLTQFECAPLESPHGFGRGVTEHDCFKATSLDVVLWLYEGVHGDADAARGGNAVCGDYATRVADVFPPHAAGGPRRELPTYFIISSHQRTLYGPFLERHGYAVEAVFPHSPTPMEWVGDAVVLYVRN